MTAYSGEFRVRSIEFNSWTLEALRLIVDGDTVKFDMRGRDCHSTFVVENGRATVRDAKYIGRIKYKYPELGVDEYPSTLEMEIVERDGVCRVEGRWYDPTVPDAYEVFDAELEKV